MKTKWWIFLSVGVGAFMSAIGVSVINIVLPVVSTDFGVDVSTIEWVITVYLLIVSGLLLSFGRLGDLRGHKIVYVSGFVIFLIAAPLCGFAQNAPMLIAARALQAFGAAMVFSNSPAILTKNFPATQRGQVLGLQAMMTYLGLTVGPSLGGWLTMQFSWRAVFFINLPIGLLALWLSARFIPRDAPSEKREPFDLIGAATFMIGLVLLLLALNQGHAWGWTSPIVVTMLIAAFVIAAIFLQIEQRVPSPMLDLSLFRQRLFSAATVSAVANYICIYTVLFLTPFYLIRARGFNPAQAGALLTAQPLLMAISAPLSGTLSDKIGSRLLGTLGMVILALGAFLLSRLDSVSSYAEIAIALAVVGLGTGIFSSPNNSALMGAAPRHRQGIAASVLATARNGGMVLGVGLAGAIFATVQTQFGGTIFDAISAGLLAAALVSLGGALTSAVR
ncbi:MAG: MFS transporter [Anaerolineales bacterium]|nr:MFS transporter [Anaerolineales bacterium]